MKWPSCLNQSELRLAKWLAGQLKGGSLSVLPLPSQIMKCSLARSLSFLLALTSTASALVTATRSGSALATKNYPAGATTVIPVIVTLAAEAGFTITAALDGLPLAMGATTVSGTGYHEVYETKVNTTTSVSTTTLAFQFIIASPGRATTEMGLPIEQPYHFVNDAPSAFAGQVLDVVAPSHYPLGLPVPVLGRLKKGASAGALAGDPLFLNGLVTSSNYTTRALQLRRGWGSTILPAATVAGTKGFDGALNGLADTAPIIYEATTTWTTKTGNISASETWITNSRIDMTATITVKAGATLTIQAGTVVRAAAGAEVWVEPGGTVNIAGTTTDPVVFAPVSTAAPWGGFWLQQTSTAAVATLNATGGLFCCWGANQTWYATPTTPVRTIFSRHRQMQPFCAIGTSAVCSLTDCALVGPITAGEPRGAGFATKDGNLALTRTLLQRAITGGEQEGGTVEVLSSALQQFSEPFTDPDVSTSFDDQDNDGIYTVPGTGHTYHFTKTVIGWTLDDGIDCGGSGNGTCVAEGCWFENCVHEAYSNSGSTRVPETHNGVHFNCGQGMECGYGDGGNGPQSLVDHCLITGCQTGARYGDNYNTFANYEGTITVQNSFLLYNFLRDAFAMDWRTSGWTYQDQRMVVKNSKLSRAADAAHQNGAEDTGVSVWNPAVDGASIAVFMPVAGSNVGAALLHDHYNDPLSTYPTDGLFTARLSTFSSKAVTIPWTAVGKVNRNQPAENVYASGTLTFQPGETVKAITAVLPGAPIFDVVRVYLGTPTNAELTGQDAWFTNTGSLPTLGVLAKAATGWDYYAHRYNGATALATTAQKPPADASSRAWTAVAYTEDSVWKTNKTAPIGWGNLGAGAPFLVLGTTLSTTAGSTIESGITTYFRHTFTVTDPAQVRALKLELLNDDGAVAFINGVPFPPINVDPGTAVGGVSGIGSDKLATATKADGVGETVYDVLNADASVISGLVAGTNVLTVEVHQGSANSSDMVCDAAITLTLNPPGSAVFGLVSLSGANFLMWDDPLMTLEASPDLNSWTPQAGVPSPVLIVPNAPRMFFRTRR